MLKMINEIMFRMAYLSRKPGFRLEFHGGANYETCVFVNSAKETGTRIKTLLKEKGYTVKDIQEAMGFEYPQAIYKWLSGNSLPTLDNFVILSRVLNTRIEDILVIDEDIVFYLL